MMERIMFRKIIGIATLLTAGLLIGCGTGSTEPEGGSKKQSEQAAARAAMAQIEQEIRDRRT